MEIKTAEGAAGCIRYESDTFEKLLSEVEDKSSFNEFYLMLLVGNLKDKKKEAVKEVKERSGRDATEVDANPLISANEVETRLRIDDLFEDYDSENTILHVINGANLCGAFTGYTLSKVKYATPQERYFLKKIKEHKAFVIIDFEEPDTLDTTIQRAASSTVLFCPPDSGIKGFMARLKGFSVNGYNLNSQRPVRQ